MLTEEQEVHLAERGWARMEQADPDDPTITWWHTDHRVQETGDDALAIQEAWDE